MFFYTKQYENKKKFIYKKLQITDQHARQAVKKKIYFRPIITALMKEMKMMKFQLMRELLLEFPLRVVLFL